MLEVTNRQLRHGIPSHVYLTTVRRSESQVTAGVLDQVVHATTFLQDHFVQCDLMRVAQIKLLGRFEEDLFGRED